MLIAELRGGTYSRNLGGWLRAEGVGVGVGDGYISKSSHPPLSRLTRTKFDAPHLLGVLLYSGISFDK